VGSRANVPERPVSPLLRDSVMAGTAGLMLGLFAVFAVKWWRQ
jgi:uncharacterized protein involved in exopolysaccharide biosynthesis